MKTPIELLKNELNDLEKALHKSFESFKAGQITKEVHEIHKNNLNPMIFTYKRSIQFLDNFTDK
jgi:hypothetical protein